MKKVLGAIAALALLILTATAALASPGNSGQCPGYQNAIVTTDGSIVLPAGTSFCVHASNANTGVLTADGVKTLDAYIALYITNNGGQVPAISNYVVYGGTEPSPSPSSTSSPSTSPSSTPGPSSGPSEEPSGTPSPTATPTLTPTPSLSPQPTSIPSLSPSLSPGPFLTLPPTDTDEAITTLANVAPGAIVLYIAISPIGLVLAAVVFYKVFARMR